MTSDKNRPITLADLEHLATKDDLKNFATKDDLKNFATKDDFDAIRTDIGAMKLDISGLKTDVGSLKTSYCVMRLDMGELKDDLRGFRSEFADFKGWTQTTLDWVVKNVGDLKQEMTVMGDARLRRFHERLTKVEKKVGLPPEEYF